MQSNDQLKSRKAETNLFDAKQIKYGKPSSEEGQAAEHTDNEPFALTYQSAIGS